MNALDLMEALGEVSDRLVSESREDSEAVRERIATKRATVAAALCICIFLSLPLIIRVLRVPQRTPPAATGGGALTETAAGTDTDADGKIETTDTTVPYHIDGIPDDELYVMLECGLEVYSVDDVRFKSGHSTAAEHLFTRYYGIYGGGAVLFEENKKALPEPLTVAGCKFMHTYGFNIYYVKGGSLMSLGSAYEGAHISADDVSAIAKKHASLEPDSYTLTVYHVQYKLYGDHASVIGAENGDVTFAPIVETAGGLPVTEFEDGAFAGMRPLRICADAESAVYDIAKQYAIDNDLIFVGMGGGGYPERYYPDWVEKLDWRLRDTSNDEFVLEDDSERISELVFAYLAGDEYVYDELERRAFYRLACTVDMAWRLSGDFEASMKYVYDADGIADLEMTDYDRHLAYTALDGGPAEYEFAYGGIDSYASLEEYIRSFYDRAGAEALLSNLYHDRGGALFVSYSGIGYVYDHREPMLELLIAADRLVLSIESKVYEYDESLGQSVFTGRCYCDIAVLDNVGGKWQLTCPEQYLDPLITRTYRDLYGGEP